jgi:hypothetical protein
MTIEGHLLPEEVGNSTIHATPTLRHTILGITLEAHNHPLFHHNNHLIPPTLASPIVGILIINNKARHSITLDTTAHHLIITGRLHNSPMVTTHLEEGFVELCLRSISDFHKHRKRRQQEDHMCAIFPGLPRLEQEEGMHLQFMEQHNKLKLKVQHLQAMHQTYSVELKILFGQLPKTCALTMRLARQEKANLRPSRQRTRTRN